MVKMELTIKTQIKQIRYGGTYWVTLGRSREGMGPWNHDVTDLATAYLALK